MFGLFKAADVIHPILGILKWQHGYWRGEFTLLDGERVPLILSGSRKGPGEKALAQAIAVPDALRDLRSQLEHALFEHYEPYAEAFREGHFKPDSEQFPEVTSPAQALQQARIVAVAIDLLDDEIVAEVCYAVPWDEEHAVGARFRGTQWIELCGSTLVP
ncbi:MAG: hypothetical protein LBB76_07345 [Azoarcus sp.]|jgi:hypothetical protein|nr:hypothetical protein [Azoarcus sp.]